VWEELATRNSVLSFATPHAFIRSSISHSVSTESGSNLVDSKRVHYCICFPKGNRLASGVPDIWHAKIPKFGNQYLGQFRPEVDQIWWTVRGSHCAPAAQRATAYLQGFPISGTPKFPNSIINISVSFNRKWIKIRWTVRGATIAPAPQRATV
jgi:hypothetical protein